MAFPTKPTSKPTWTDADVTGLVRAEPTSGKKAVGYLANERPSRQSLNWLFWIIGQWMQYCEDAIDQVKGLTANFDAYVGPVGAGSLATHSDLAAAIASIGPGGRILILQNLTLNATVQITKLDVELVLKPGVTIAKGSANTGLQLSANGIRIKGGRFAGFTTAILVDATSLYCMIGETRFSTNTTDISDTAGIATTYALVQEA